MAFQSIGFADILENHPVAAFFDFYKSKIAVLGKIPVPNYDPLDIPHLLPWLLVLDETSQNGEIEHRYRFAGTECVALLGVDMTGRILGDKISDQATRFRRQEFGDAKKMRTPSFSRAPIPIQGREFTEILCGVFPLQGEGEDEAWQFHVIVAPSTLQL